MKKFDYITPIKNELEYELHNSCRTFMLIGMPFETPRYYNYSTMNDKNRNDNYLYIGSTQTSDLWFRIKVTKQYKKSILHNDIRDFWNQFKEFRTEFLIKNYPTINPY